jgi:hypothetical protein
MSEVAEQADTVMVSTASLMRQPSFLRGVEEYRARRRPDFECDDWQYERGRQWAAIAPRNLNIFTSSGRVSRLALAIFNRNIV